MPISPAQAPVVSRLEFVQRVKRRGGEDLGLEQLGSAAVVGKGEKGVAGVEIALDLAEIGLEGPEGQQDAAADAIFGLGPGEDGVQAFATLLRAVDRRCFEISDCEKSRKVLRKTPWLRSAFSTFRVLTRALEEGGGLFGRDAFGDGLGLHRRQEVAEIAATGGGGCWGGKGQGKEGGAHGLSGFRRP